MKKHLLLLSLLLFFTNFTSIAQITFEKGYFVTNSAQKVECLIKNIDWNYNPTQFAYKLSKDDEPQTATIETVREFGIYNSAKYIRSTVKIDRSSESYYHLSTIRRPVFEEKQLFLQVLIEGKASLYEYNGDSKRFFYKKDDSGIEQLIFKTFKTSGGQVFQNKSFQQQLSTDLDCSKITPHRIQNLEYKKSSLKNLFADYNECQNIEYKDYQEKQIRDLFDLSIRPRINHSSLKVGKTATSLRDTNFGSKYNFGFGVETEFTFPFNKNKWAIILEPTYQQFEAEKITVTRPLHGRTQIAQVDYKSIELPIGIRHYFYLNSNSRIFINAAFLFDFSIKSTVAFSRPEGTDLGTIEIKKRNNLAFGTGYRYRNYHIEIRYQPSRNILGANYTLNYNYETVSAILGYSIF